MAYLRSNCWMVLAAAYLLLACVLHFTGTADIFPPCIVSTLIGRPCPGCGLTRAGLSLMQLDFRAAWNFNPAIFIVAPAMLYFLLADVRGFYQKRAAAD